MATAAFLERAASLTRDPVGRAERELAAAWVKRDAGALESALGLLAAVEAGPADALRAAEVEHLRGQIAFDQRHNTEAAHLLLDAAARLAELESRAVPRGLPGRSGRGHLGQWSGGA